MAEVAIKTVTVIGGIGEVEEGVAIAGMTGMIVVVDSVVAIEDG